MSFIISPWNIYDSVYICWLRNIWCNNKEEYLGEIRITLEPNLDNLYFIISLSIELLENNYGKLYPNCKKRFDSLKEAFL